MTSPTPTASMRYSIDAVDLFAGPGGWDLAAHHLGLDHVIGVEWDPLACATRAAAGLTTIRADVAALPSEPFAGRARGLIASPPCTMFSAAGTRSGSDAVSILGPAMARVFAGDDVRQEVRLRVADEILGAVADEVLAKHDRRVKAGTATPANAPTAEQLAAEAYRRATMAALVLEPARWAHDLKPEWIALEQVPAVLPLWRVLADALRLAGYSVWCGNLVASDYGVAQDRTRAILMASLARIVHPPHATHAPGGAEPSLFGDALPPRVTMAEALGWGALLPAPTLTGGGTGAGGGVEVWAGAHARDRVAAGIPRVGFPRLDDRGDSPDGYRERDLRRIDEPAQVVTEKARSWIVSTGLGWGQRDTPSGCQEIDAATSPAPTVTGMSGRQWQIHLNPGASPSQPNRRTYSLDEPAPTIAFGNDAASWRWVPLLLEDGIVVPPAKWNNGEADDPDYPAKRPALTLAGDPRVPQPGHKLDKGSPDSPGRMQGSIRLDIAEAAVLQSFPPWHPWAGGSSARFLQVGNAVPPILAAHVLAATTGLDAASIPTVTIAGPPAAQEVPA